MDTKQYCVAIVFDQNFGIRLESLSRKKHVWIIESPENVKYAKQIWEKERLNNIGYSLDSGVTSFSLKGDVSIEEEFIEEKEGRVETPWYVWLLLGLALFVLAILFYRKHQREKQDKK